MLFYFLIVLLWPHLTQNKEHVMSNKPFWSVDASIKLTRYFILGTSLGIVLLFIFSPFLGVFFSEKLAPVILDKFPLILLTIYIGGTLGLILMYYLFKIVTNIAEQQVFIWQNIAFLRIISWICLLGGIVGLLSAFYWVIWLPVSFMAIFIFLIIRVVKNILSVAIRIKEENDYTI